MSQPSNNTARYLRVIRIDDTVSTPVRRDRYDPVEGDGIVGHPLELVTYEVEGKVGLAINSLGAARTFWLQFGPASTPDIVLGDINFEWDAESPLRAWGRNIPTGLMHCKPFVAIARSNGRPLSVILHTANRKVWSALLVGTDVQTNPGRVFGLLAAQEAMEIAAILGDEIQGASAQKLEPVWEWLDRRTLSTPKEALLTAVADYRRQVVTALRGRFEGSNKLRLRVGAREWRRLLAWCRQMSAQPRALNGEADIGLPLLYPDGQTDRISFASLFADVQNISTHSLPASCFEVVRVEEPWALVNGLPQVGALVAECGGVGEAIKAAAEALRQLPLGQVRLRHNLRKVEDDPLALGLAVLFRVIEIYKSDEDRWGGIWAEGHWNPTTLKEVDEPEEYHWAVPLSKWVGLAEQALRDVCEEFSDESGFVEADDVEEVFLTNIPPKVPAKFRDRMAPGGMGVYLDILCDLGRAESRKGNDGQWLYRIREAEGAVEGKRPPSRPPAGAVKLVWDSENLPTLLRDSLGFGSRGPGRVSNDNAVGQILFDAFVGSADDTHLSANEKAKRGRPFLLRFRAGEGPGWLREVCRGYCRDVLGWAEEERWPACIAQRA